MWWYHEGLTRELLVVAAIVGTLIVLPILTLLTLQALHGWRLEARDLSARSTTFFTRSPDEARRQPLNRRGSH